MPLLIPELFICSTKNETLSSAFLMAVSVNLPQTADCSGRRVNDPFNSEWSMRGDRK